MGRNRIVKKAASSVSPVAVSAIERRSSLRLRQPKLHEVKNGTKEQKLSSIRKRGSNSKSTGEEQSSKFPFNLVDLVGRKFRDTKTKATKKLKSGVQRSWTKLSEKQKEEILKNFDLNLEYGPCCGISRTERLKRAQSFGLEVEERISFLLKALKGPKSPHDICLWDRPSGVGLN